MADFFTDLLGLIVLMIAFYGLDALDERYGRWSLAGFLFFVISVAAGVGLIEWYV